MSHNSDIVVFYRVYGIINSMFIYGVYPVDDLFLQAVGRGLRDPSFRVIQNHFASAGNLGEISAKVGS